MTKLNFLKEYDIFVGIDVDKKSYAFSVKDRDTMMTSKKIPASPEQLLKYMNNAFSGKKALFAYETGPTGFGLHDYLAKNNCNCYVIPAMSIPKAPNQKVKNNRLDSEQIAHQLSSGQLKPIRVPCECWRDLRCLAKTRDNYVRGQKVTKQRIKALLLFHGLHEKIDEPSSRWSNNYIKELVRLNCDVAVRQSLNMLLDDLTYFRKKLADSMRILKEFCSKHETIQKNIGFLISIPGIGFTTASCALARIGDPVNLRDQRELGAFIGLVPAEHSTGDTVTRSGITHNGDSVLRSLLVEAAWIAIRKDNQLREFYYRIHSRHNKCAAAKKAITAVARKLTLIMYRVLKDQRNYIER